MYRPRNCVSTAYRTARAPVQTPTITFRRSTSTQSGISANQSLRYTNIFLGSTTLLALGYIYNSRNTLRADSTQIASELQPGDRWAATTATLSPELQGDSKTQYASKETVQKVVEILSKELKSDQVVTDPDDRFGHGCNHDTWHTAAMPDVVVYAESTEDVSLIVKLANAHSIPITPYSGGTSLEGHVTCPYGGICIDLSRMNQILEIHDTDSDAVVQPGCQWEGINAELKEKGLELFFPLDPGPGACIGGMIATGCSGTNAVRYGTAKGEWFLNATVVLPSGEIIKTRQRSRKSSAGYDLTKLFIGAEGTLGIVTEATIRLAPVLPTRVAVCGFPGVEEAVLAVTEVIDKGVQMQCVELCDPLMMHAIHKFGNVSMPLPKDLDTIFFKFQGPTTQAINQNVDIVTAIAKKHGGKQLVFAENEEQSDELWQARKSAGWSALALVPGGTTYSTDVCVPVSRLPRLVKETQEDLAANKLVGPILGHVGDGNFHAALIFDPKIPGEFEKVDAAAHRMVERAIALDGTCTGEHGVGIGKKSYLRSELGDGTLGVMKAIKQTLDPKGIMNPGKLYPD